MRVQVYEFKSKMYISVVSYTQPNQLLVEPSTSVSSWKFESPSIQESN